MSLTFASNLTKMIDAGLGGELVAPDTSVAVGYRMQYNLVSGPVASWNDPEGGLPVNIATEFGPIQSGTGDPSPENVRPISGRTEVKIWHDATHDTSADPTLTIQLGQTVYGGSLDVTNGVLTVDMAMVDMGTLNWLNSGGNKLFYTSGIASEIRKSVSNVELFSWGITSIGLNGTSYNSITQNTPYSICVSTSGNILATLETTQAYSDANAFKSAMSGVQLCYELETPLTVQLSAQTITSLLGQNNVWSDAGDVSVTWKEKLYTEGY